MESSPPWYSVVTPEDKAFHQAMGQRIAARRKALAISVEELIGESPDAINGKGKRGPTPKLQRQLEQIGQLPRAKQRFVTDMLDTVLQQRG